MADMVNITPPWHQCAGIITVACWCEHSAQTQPRRATSTAVHSSSCSEMMCPHYFAVLCSEPSQAWSVPISRICRLKKRHQTRAQLQKNLLLPKTGKTGGINLLSAMTKYSAASESSAFSWDQGSTLFGKNAIKCVCFHYKRKHCFVKLQQFLRAAAQKPYSTGSGSAELWSTLYNVYNMYINAVYCMSIFWSSL